MTEYIPSTTEWVRDQVTLYEESNGKEGYELRGLPVIIVTHRGRCLLYTSPSPRDRG